MIYVACLNKSAFFTLTRVLTLIIHQIRIKSNVLSLLIFLNTSFQVVVANIYNHAKVLINKCKQVIQMVSFDLKEKFSSFADVEATRFDLALHFSFSLSRKSCVTKVECISNYGE